MKKILGIVIAVIILVSASCAMAHSPSNLIAKYDSDTSLLWIKAPHPVAKPNSHYIEEYKIYVNGKKYAELELKSQKDKTGSEAAFYIPGLEKGDTVKIEAKCSQSGKNKITITI